MQVSKWGNSLAVRLPKAVVEILGLKEGDDVQIVSADKHALKIARDERHEDAASILRKYRGRMPKGFKFDRDEANER